jgi:hypothetical protein
MVREVRLLWDNPSFSPRDIDRLRRLERDDDFPQREPSRTGATRNQKAGSRERRGKSNSLMPHRSSPANAGDSLKATARTPSPLSSELEQRSGRRTEAQSAAVPDASSLLPRRDERRLRECRKQISLFFPVSDWQAIRREAARRGIPMTELCRRWIRPELDELHRRAECREDD